MNSNREYAYHNIFFFQLQINAFPWNLSAIMMHSFVKTETDRLKFPQIVSPIF